MVAGTLGVTGDDPFLHPSLGANPDEIFTGTYAIDSADPIDVDIVIDAVTAENPDTATVTLQGTNNALDAGTYMLQRVPANPSNPWS